jgi:hypothetical protein
VKLYCQIMSVLLLVSIINPAGSASAKATSLAAPIAVFSHVQGNVTVQEAGPGRRPPAAPLIPSVGRRSSNSSPWEMTFACLRAAVPFSSVQPTERLC